MTEQLKDVFEADYLRLTGNSAGTFDAEENCYVSPSLQLKYEFWQEGRLSAKPAQVPDAAEGVEVRGYLLSCAVGGDAIDINRNDIVECQQRYGGAILDLMTVEQHNLIVSALRDGGDVERWVPVSERLPDEHKAEYLCLFEDGRQQVTDWLYDDTEGWCFWYGDPTHWQPLPAPPLSKPEPTTSQAGVGK